MRTEQERTEFYALVSDIRKLLSESERKLNDMIMKFEGQCESDQTPNSFSRIALSSNKSLFVGKKPVAVIFQDGRSIPVKKWKEVVYHVMMDCISNKEMHEKLLFMRGRVAGRQNLILSDKSENLINPLKIEEGIYIETRMNTEMLLVALTDKLTGAVGYDCSNIYIEYNYI